MITRELERTLARQEAISLSPSATKNSKGTEGKFAAEARGNDRKDYDDKMAHRDPKESP